MHCRDSVAGSNVAVVVAVAVAVALSSNLSRLPATVSFQLQEKEIVNYAGQDLT